MSTPLKPVRTCGSCGTALDAEAPEGLCPICLLRGGLTTELLSSPTVDDEVEAPCKAARVLDLGASRGPTAPREGFGDYELLEEIARGGMGVVYKARQISLNRTVALKMLRAGPLVSKEFVHRFRTEASAAAVLQHPNIVAVHEVGLHKGEHFFSMDYVEGRDLERIAREGPMPARRAAEYVRKIAGAVHYAHQQGILHRDLKPSNVLIASNDEPRVTDFGLAKQLGSSSDVTLSGQVLGTPGYLPPEQASGSRGAVRPWSDVYALGAILYCLVTGRPPFAAGTVEETLNQVLNQEPIAPRLLNPTVPLDVQTICLKCLEKEPARRYSTALELTQELERFLKDEPIIARPVNAAGKVWRWCRRKPGLAAAIATAVLLGCALILGGAVAAWRIKEGANLMRQRAYASDVNLAYHALQEKNPGRATELLGRYLAAQNEPDSRGFEWYYLWQQCQGDQMDSIDAHNAGVGSAMVSPNGKWLVTAGLDSRVALWELSEKRFQSNLYSLKSKSLATRVPAFSPDGNLLAIRDTDGVAILETQQWRLLRELPEAAVQIAFSPKTNWLLAACADGLKIWDTKSWEIIRILPIQVDLFDSSPDESLLAVSRGPRVELLQFPSGEPLGRLPVDPEGVREYSLKFSPNGRFLAAGGYDGDITIWNVADRSVAAHLKPHKKFVMGLAFSPDARRLAVGAGDQFITIWDTQTWRQESELFGHRHQVWDLVFTPDGRMLISASRDHTVKFWNAAMTRREILLPHAHAPLAFSPDSRLLLALETNGMMKSFECATLQEVAACELNQNKIVSAAAISPRWDKAAIGYTDGTMELRDNPSGTLRQTLVAATNRVFFLRFSPDGKWLAAIQRRYPFPTPLGRLLLWESGQLMPVPAILASDTSPVGFSSDSRMLAAAGTDHVVILWDLLRQRCVYRLKGHEWDISSIAFSPDGRTLATASWDGTARVWDVATGRPKTRLFGQTISVDFVTFSPNGRCIATAAMDQTVTLWDAMGGQELLTLPWKGAGHSALLESLVFSPDGTSLAAGGMLLDGQAGAVQIWHAGPISASSPRGQ